MFLLNSVTDIPIKIVLNNETMNKMLQLRHNTCIQVTILLKHFKLSFVTK